MDDPTYKTGQALGFKKQYPGYEKIVPQKQQAKQALRTKAKERGYIGMAVDKGKDLISGAVSAVKNFSVSTDPIKSQGIMNASEKKQLDKIDK